ncbi:hypothetical protein HQ533_04030 [Candidatus Woesearchaeota archaeon]|nr:hypothetical protein [Candidatus Woesearchaeota archaeon]
MSNQLQDIQRTGLELIGEGYLENLIEDSDRLQQKDKAYKSLGKKPDHFISQYEKPTNPIRKARDVIRDLEGVEVTSIILKQQLKDANEKVADYEKNHEIVKRVKNPVELTAIVYSGEDYFKTKSIRVAIPISEKQYIKSNAKSVINALYKDIEKMFIEALNETVKNYEIKSKLPGKYLEFRAIPEDASLALIVEQVSDKMNEIANKRNHDITQTNNITMKFFYDKTGALAYLKKELLEEKTIPTRKRPGPKRKIDSNATGFPMQQVRTDLEAALLEEGFVLSNVYNTTSNHLSRGILRPDVNGRLYSEHRKNDYIQGELIKQRVFHHEREYVSVKEFKELTGLRETTYRAWISRKHVRTEKTEDGVQMKTGSLKKHLSLSNFSTNDRHPEGMWGRRKRKRK